MPIPKGKENEKCAFTRKVNNLSFKRHYNILRSKRIIYFSFSEVQDLGKIFFPKIRQQEKCGRDAEGVWISDKSEFFPGVNFFLAIIP